jgi:hypothetical protein
MAAGYFNRFRAIINNNDLARVPGNITNFRMSVDNGSFWIGGMDAYHQMSSVGQGNRTTMIAFTTNLERGIIPIDYANMDYETTPVAIQLIGDNSDSFISNVYNPPGVVSCILPRVYYTNEGIVASYNTNTTRDLSFNVIGNLQWINNG